jgi:hypothetical protein
MNSLMTPKLDQLEANARVWVFQSIRTLNTAEIAEIDQQLDQFLSKWAAHGSALKSGFEIRFNRFIVVAVDEAQANATGCSIDSLMRLIQAIDEKYSLNLFDRMRVSYRTNLGIEQCDANEFRKKWSAGDVGLDTVVFNNVIETLGDLNKNWETTARACWVANLAP